MTFQKKKHLVFHYEYTEIKLIHASISHKYLNWGYI